MFTRPLLSPLDESPDRGGSGVENAYLMAVNDAPETIRLGTVGRALVHHAGCTVLQRPINDVAVAGDPANVCGAPVSVFFLEIEYPFRGQISSDRISACGVNHSLRLAGGS